MSRRDHRLPRGVQMHQRQQGLGRRRVADRMRGQERGQLDRLAAQLAAHRALALVCAVALAEQEIENGLHRPQPRRQLGCRRQVEVDRRLAQLRLRPGKAFGHRVRGRQQQARDLLHFHAAQGLQCQHHLRWPRQRRVATHEHHPQLVVGELVAEGRLRRRGGGPHGGGEPACHLALLDRQATIAPDSVEGKVARDLDQPGHRLVGHAVARPQGQGAQERLLAHGFDDVEAAGAEQARQGRGDGAGPGAEQRLDAGVNFLAWGHGAIVGRSLAAVNSAPEGPGALARRRPGS